MHAATADRLAAAVEDPCSKVFKAVKPSRNAVADGQIEGEESEELVGLSQWYVGYVNVPKVDPFASKDKGDDGKTTKVPAGSFFATPDPAPAATVGGNAPETETDKKKNPSDELTRRIGNTYISAIRGKKHVYLRRMIVHPDHQRQGIGQKLLDWGMDVADEQKIVSWLFARPAGRRLYEKAGFKVVATLEVEAEEMVVPPVVSMMRKPQARRNGRQSVQAP